MKSLIFLGSMLLSFVSCTDAQPGSSIEKPKEKKALVVYFSYSGNTKSLATQIQKSTGADIFEIEPVQAYPSVYDEVTKQAKEEIEAGKRPALKSKPADLSKYDVIFVGSPCWWSTIAPPVATFLSTYDFAGKTIVPFMTHEGSGMGRSVQDIRKLCPKAKVSEGLPVRGGSVANAQNEINEFLHKLELNQ